MANFAKSQMLKYGWTEGKGLGKNENGITEALKPIIKFDNTGIGYNKNEYDWLASLLSTKNSIELKHKSQEIFANDNDQYKTLVNTYKKSQQEAYEKFQNTSTLQDGNLIQNSSAISDKAESAKTVIHFPLMDNELFKACGSRTAHKTARHGHTLGGKLERIALQDKMFLNGNDNDIFQPNTNPIVADTKMIHRKNRAEFDTEETEQETDSNGNASQSEAEVLVVKSKTTRKKNRRKMNNLSQQLSSCNIEENDTESACKYLQQNDKKVRKKRKSKERRKTKDDSSSLRNNLKYNANDKVLETAFLLTESMEHMNIQKQIPELVKSDETEINKLEQEKNRNYNKKKRLRSQEQDCVIAIDEPEIYIKKFKIIKKSCNRNISNWYSLMLNDEASKGQSNQETDSYDKSKILNNEIKDMIRYKFFDEKMYDKKLEMQKEYKAQLNALSENYNKKKKNKNKDEVSSGRSMLHNVPDKQSTKVKKSKKSTLLEEMAEMSTKLNFRIQKKKKQRHVTKQKKQVENVIHKLKNKVFSHDMNALIKDLTTINITEKTSINKKKVTQTHLTPV